MNRSAFLLLAAAAQISIASAEESGSMSDVLLGWARSIVKEVAPENNVYGSHPTYVEWRNAATGERARNRSVCSSFASHLLEQSFGYTTSDIDAWFAKPNPQAVDYHDTIAAGRGFERILHVGAIRPGDIIAIARPPGSRPTGHVMIVTSLAAASSPRRPVEPGTQQYEIGVIDSANSGHGPADTRLRADGTWTTGVGHGTVRLYVRDDATLAGYAWSTTTRSLFRPASVRKIAVGRLDPARVPPAHGRPGNNPVTQDAGTSGDDAPTDD